MKVLSSSSCVPLARVMMSVSWRSTLLFSVFQAVITCVAARRWLVEIQMRFSKPAAIEN